MSTIIRVKRSLNEDPLDDKIVLNCKRLKIDQNATILKFAGTVEKTTNIQEHLTKITKEEAKDIVTRKNLTENSLKNRLDQKQEQRTKNRFKIVNLSRPQNQEEATSSELTILDVEKDIFVNQLKQGTSKEGNGSSSYSDISEEGFVYDIYISDTPNDILSNDKLDINELSVLEYNDYLYSCPRLMNDQDDDSMDEDDSDENDEGNWRNDYPDEEELSDNDSIDERHMRRAMENFDIENELSSDGEYSENGFVYSVDSEGINFEDDLDYCNVNRYGEAYARYRRRNLRELKNDDDEDNNSDDDSFHSD